MAKLFESSWVNSLGEKDGWAFGLVGDAVHWNYHALFDACTGEESNGSLRISYKDFKGLLEEFLRKGEAHLKTGDGCVILVQKEDRTLVKVDYFCYGVSDSIPEIPSQVFELFGIAKN
jgi:hypothetical protein